MFKQVKGGKTKMYQVGKQKKRKLEIANKICKKYLNRDFDFAVMHKEDFLEIWEIAGALNRITKDKESMAEAQTLSKYVLGLEISMSVQTADNSSLMFGIQKRIKNVAENYTDNTQTDDEY